MCGIAGFKTGKRIDEKVLARMVAALYHRGPDASGFYRTVGYSAGMRRLSINDLVTGDQPLFNEDRSIVLFYNGEIYNCGELRRELEANAHRFRSRSDGEVICHLYEERGEELFELLDGMFAVALWIERERKLILARDLPGEKPLYYASVSGTEVAFASEIKSLVRFPGIDLTLNDQALWDLPTFCWIPEPDTIYRSIKAVPRGHLLVVDDQGSRLRGYPNRFNSDETMLSDEAVIEETRRVVTEAVRSRLLSDVPIGSFLSSGLDSSIVTTLASMALPKLTTFTVGFEDVEDPYHGRADEATYAEEYARELGTEHCTIRATAASFRQDLEAFCMYGDQPFAISSGLGILAIARAAREKGIKVLLSGDGADECFGGYSWYFHLDRRRNGGKRRHNREKVTSFQNFAQDLNERLEILDSYSPQERAWAWHYYASESEKQKLYNRERFESVRSSLRFFEEYKEGSDWTAEDFIRHDRQFYLPLEMLRKVDRMTMAYSVEGRLPFVAPSVLAHVERLNYVHLVRGDVLKWALREAFKPILPQSIVSRPKHGFNVPIDHWLKREWSDLFDEAFAGNSALMNMGIIHHGSADVARRMLFDAERLNGHTILSLIVLNRWLETQHANGATAP